MKTEVYVFGHKNPDTDSILSSILLCELKNQIDTEKQYVARALGKPNAETQFLLDELGIKSPEILEHIEENQMVCLVDHNENSQTADDISKADILCVVDHHKISFKYPKPIEYICKPYGCSATVISEMFEEKGIEMNDFQKKLALFAMLSDTVILKSPTTTELDRKFVEEFSEELGIDYKEFGIKMFEKKMNAKTMSAEQILKTDYKKIEIKGKMFGIGQCETVNILPFLDRKQELIKTMEKEKKEQGLYAVVLLLTDILKQGSEVLIVSEDKNLENAFEYQENSRFVKGLLSRKKQVIPAFSEALS